jgi:hypothetical protein
MVSNAIDTSGPVPKVARGPGVFLAIPSGGKNVTGLTQNITYWYLRALQLGIRLPYPPWIPTNLRPLDAARNTTVKEFLELNYDYIWWIDDDIVPPLDAFERLFSTMQSRPDIDALGAVCFSMKSDAGKYFPYPVTLRRDPHDGKYTVYYGQGVEWVDALGGACVLVRRKVYESMVRPYEYHYHKDGTLALTCDFDIWQKAKDAGYNLYVDFGISCDHIRTCSLKGIQDLLAGEQQRNK